MRLLSVSALSPLTGFGTFEKLHRQARMERNPHMGEAYRTTEPAVPSLRPLRLKDRVQSGRPEGKAVYACGLLVDSPYIDILQKTMHNMYAAFP